jgi:poly(3-hydroxybutyrate) depolymerase
MQTLISEPVSAPGQRITVKLTYAGVERDVVVFVPSSYVPDTAMPLVVALHGNSGDASVMYADNKRIVAHAESDGFIAVFPNGLPRPGKPDSRNYYWTDPINITYMAFLLNELSERYAIDDSRIYFVGFSGGAILIDRLACEPLISARIAGIGTVAGTIGGKMIEALWESPNTTNYGHLGGNSCSAMTERAEVVWGFHDPSVTDGCAIPAFLVHGALDEKLPLAGGFGDGGEIIIAGFETEVAIWRHFTGALAEASAQTPALPPSATARAWTNAQTGHAVVAVVDDQLGHHWPSWDLMGALWSFFQCMPARETPPDA